MTNTPKPKTPPHVHRLRYHVRIYCPKTPTRAPSHLVVASTNDFQEACEIYRDIALLHPDLYVLDSVVLRTWTPQTGWLDCPAGYVQPPILENPT